MPIESTLNNPTRSEWIIQAVHPKYAFGWKNIPNKQPLEAFEVTLSEPRTKTILITDMEGQPLAGVKVWPFNAGTHESPDPLFRNSLSLPTDTGLLSILMPMALHLFVFLPETYPCFSTLPRRVYISWKIPMKHPSLR